MSRRQGLAFRWMGSVATAALLPHNPDSSLEKTSARPQKRLVPVQARRLSLMLTANTLKHLSQIDGAALANKWAHLVEPGRRRVAAKVT